MSAARRALLILAATQLITGSTYIVAKVALAEFEPLALAFHRFLITGLFFAVLFRFRGIPFFPPRPLLSKVAILAFLAVPLNQSLFLAGQRWTAAAHGALFYATTPVLVLALNAIGNRERRSAKAWVGVMLGLAGVALVVSEKGIGFTSQGVRGDLLIGAAVFAWAWYTVLSKRLAPHVSPLHLTGWLFILGALIFLPVGLPAALQQNYAAITVHGVTGLLFLAFLTSVVGYFSWMYALAHLPAERVAIIQNLQPVVAAALGWLVLGEHVSWHFLAGALVVATGVWLTLQEKGAPAETGARENHAPSSKAQP